MNAVQFEGRGKRREAKIGARKVVRMRLTEFHQLVVDEFGDAKGKWVVSSHVFSGEGKTAGELIDAGVDPRDVWGHLCDDFDIPEERRLGIDRPGE